MEGGGGGGRGDGMRRRGGGRRWERWSNPAGINILAATRYSENWRVKVRRRSMYSTLSLLAS